MSPLGEHQQKKEQKSRHENLWHFQVRERTLICLDILVIQENNWRLRNCD